MKTVRTKTTKRKPTRARSVGLVRGERSRRRAPKPKRRRTPFTTEEHKGLRVVSPPKADVLPFDGGHANKRTPLLTEIKQRDGMLYVRIRELSQRDPDSFLASFSCLANDDGARAFARLAKLVVEGLFDGCLLLERLRTCGTTGHIDCHL